MSEAPAHHLTLYERLCIAYDIVQNSPENKGDWRTRFWLDFRRHPRLRPLLKGRRRATADDKRLFGPAGQYLFDDHSRLSKARLLEHAIIKAKADDVRNA